MPPIDKKTKLKVYKLLPKIPKGKVSTYKALTKAVNLNPRVIGMILNRNQKPQKYPCYKIIKNNGGLGGYGGGIKKKNKLLKNDGVVIKNNKIAEKFIVRDF
ncbi:MAG: methylated-DNA--[protein]-cysteine S-methyltransferase [Candidatus Moranbacteria bacterium]|nr:methylated-DNA--[protein]-cysteine S-methyltransferase [Candidatus Moranbacteria bacterium]